MSNPTGDALLARIAELEAQNAELTDRNKRFAQKIANFANVSQEVLDAARQVNEAGKVSAIQIGCVIETDAFTQPVTLAAVKHANGQTILTDTDGTEHVFKHIDKLKLQEGF